MKFNGLNKSPFEIELIFFFLQKIPEGDFDNSYLFDLTSNSTSDFEVLGPLNDVYLYVLCPISW